MDQRIGRPQKFHVPRIPLSGVGVHSKYSGLQPALSSTIFCMDGPQRLAPTQDMDRPPKASIGKFLIEWTAVMVTLFGLVAIYIFFLDNTRFGFQVLCLVVQTFYVFFYVFCDTRYWHGYSLRNKTVQHELPRLLRIHCLFLVLLFAVVTAILSARPYMPPLWFIETKGNRPISIYSTGFFLICFAVVETQVILSRKILSRGLSAKSTSPEATSAKPLFP